MLWVIRSVGQYGRSDVTFGGEVGPLQMSALRRHSSLGADPRFSIPGISCFDCFI